MRHRFLVVMLPVCTLPFLLSAAGPPVDEPTGKDVPEIRTLLDRQVADWNRKDLDGFLAGYWDSPKVVFLSGGERSEGFAAMRDRYRKNYQAEGKEMGTLKFSGIEVERLGSDSAFARGRWELTKSDGSHPGGLFTLILKKLPEGWRIVHDHTSSNSK
jgi:ketosteroid isomerase-like protein